MGWCRLCLCESGCAAHTVITSLPLCGHLLFYVCGLIANRSVLKIEYMFEPRVLTYFPHNSHKFHSSKSACPHNRAVECEFDISKADIYHWKNKLQFCIFSHSNSQLHGKEDTHKKMWLCLCFAVEIHAKQTHYLSHMKRCNWRQETVTSLWTDKSNVRAVGRCCAGFRGTAGPLCRHGVIIELQVFLSLGVK